MKLGVEHARRCWSTSPGCRSTASSDAAPTAACGSAPRVRNSDLAATPAVRARYPVLAQALLAGASGQLRNMATIGGNLLQRTRCLYFQDVTKPCNKREPGTGCSGPRRATTATWRILGHSAHCVATHPSDMAVALAALDAVVQRARPGRPARGPARRASTGCPATTPQRETTVLAPGDADHRGRAAAAGLGGGRSAYRKVRDRASYAFAVGSVAAALERPTAWCATCGSRSAGWPPGRGGPRGPRRRCAAAPATERRLPGRGRSRPPRPHRCRDNAFKVPLRPGTRRAPP